MNSCERRPNLSDPEWRCHTCPGCLRDELQETIEAGNRQAEQLAAKDAELRTLRERVEELKEELKRPITIHCESRKNLATLLLRSEVQRDALREALEPLIDERPCSFITEAKRYCATHAEAMPCPHWVARQALARIDAKPTIDSTATNSSPIDEEADDGE